MRSRTHEPFTRAESPFAGEDPLPLAREESFAEDETPVRAESPWASAEVTADALAEEPLVDEEVWSGSAAQIDFRNRVLAAHLERSRQRRGAPKRDLRSDQLQKVRGTDIRMRADAADAASRMLEAANAALQKAKAAGDADALRTIGVGATSGYRAQEHQRKTWEANFAGYYNDTQAARNALPAGPHSDQAVAYMIETYGIPNFVAAPGYSNHQGGIAIDLWQDRKTGQVIPNRKSGRAKWRASWLHQWLRANAATFGFVPYSAEEWHWEFKPDQVSKLMAKETVEEAEEIDEVFEQSPESFEEAVDEEDEDKAEDEEESFGEELFEELEEDEEESDEEFDEEVEEAETTDTVVFPSGESLSVVTGFAEAKGEDYWDPTGSGNPLLDTGPEHKSKRLSTHLTVRELTTTGGASADVARIDPKLVESLQRIRDHVGKPVTITSGYRSWKRNKQVYAGKKPTFSQHCGGRAADIKIAGMNGLAIGHAAIDACGPAIGIGLGKTFAHIDVRGVAAAWNYGGVADSWIAEIKEHQRTGARSTPTPAPQPSSPSGGTTAAPPPLGGPKVPGPEYKVRTRGLERAGGERVDATLTKMRQAGVVSISNEDIDTLQRVANVETGGRVQALNTWDAAVVSIGFMQWTLPWGKLHAWIAKAPDAFRRYGIEIDPSRTYTIGKTTVAAIKGAATTEELRWDGWARRFYEAGLDPEIIAAEADYATAVVLPEATSAAKRWLKAIAGGFDLFQKSYKASLPLRGLFVEAHNNRPVSARDALRNGLSRALRDGVSTPAGVYELMKQEVLAAFPQNGAHIVQKTARLKL